MIRHQDIAGALAALSEANGLQRPLTVWSDEAESISSNATEIARVFLFISYNNHPICCRPHRHPMGHLERQAWIAASP